MDRRGRYNESGCRSNPDEGHELLSEVEVRMVDSNGNNATHGSALTVSLAGNLYWPSTTPGDCGPSTYDDTAELPAGQSVLTFWARSTGTAVGHNGTIKVTNPPGVFPDDAIWRNAKIFHKWDANATSGDGTTPPPPPPPTSGSATWTFDQTICQVQVNAENNSAAIRPCDNWTPKGCATSGFYLYWTLNNSSPGSLALHSAAVSAMLTGTPVAFSYSDVCEGAFNRVVDFKLSTDADLL